MLSYWRNKKPTAYGGLVKGAQAMTKRKSDMAILIIKDLVGIMDSRVDYIEGLLATQRLVRRARRFLSSRKSNSRDKGKK